MSSSSQLFMAVGSESTKASATSELAAGPAKSSRGRKPSAKAKGGGAGVPKKPQRGLGVEQLERLRLQERWKKMTEMPSPAPLESVPVQYGAGAYGGAAAARLVLGSPGVQAADHLGNGLVDPRFHPHHLHLLHHDNNHVDDHQYQRIRVDDPFDISSFKKKRFTGGEINGPCPSTFYGLNTTENDVNRSVNMTGDHLTLGFATPNSKIPRNSQEGEQVEVMAVHRKGFSARDHQDHLVMEYRFFPGQGGAKNDIVSTSSPSSSLSGTNFKKIWPSELEASYYTNNLGVDSCNNPLDLSLKL